MRGLHLMLSIMALIVARADAQAQGTSGVTLRTQPAVTAKSGPSLQETMQWLVSRLPDFATVTYESGVEAGEQFIRAGISQSSLLSESDVTVKTKQVDSCTLEVKEMMTISGRELELRTVKLALGDLDPVSITARFGPAEEKKGFYSTKVWKVTMQPSAGKAMATAERLGEQTKGEDSKPEYRIQETSKYDIILRGKEEADRVAEALKYAIKSCGGKADPF